MNIVVHTVSLLLKFQKKFQKKSLRNAQSAIKAALSVCILPLSGFNLRAQVFIARIIKMQKGLRVIAEAIALVLISFSFSIIQ